MTTEFTEITPDENGARSLVRALHPQLEAMWRSERQNLSTDDLVAIIDSQGPRTSIRLETRSAIYTQLKCHNPTYFVIDHIVNPAPSKPGRITIWTVIGFKTGQTCILPVTLVRS